MPTYHYEEEAADTPGNIDHNNSYEMLYLSNSLLTCRPGSVLGAALLSAVRLAPS